MITLTHMVRKSESLKCQNIDCVYTLEPPRRKYVYTCIPQFDYIKVGLGAGVYIARTCFYDVLLCQIVKYNGFILRKQ